MQGLLYIPDGAKVIHGQYKIRMQKTRPEQIWPQRSIRHAVRNIENIAVILYFMLLAM